METKHVLDNGRPIREAKALYGLSVDALYYYEDIGLIAPKRNDANGYRIFGADDFMRLNVITELRAMGFSLDSIKSYFADHTLAATMALLNDELASIEAELDSLHRAKTDVLQSINRYSTAVTLAQAEQVSVLHIPERRFLLISRDAVYYNDIPYLFAKRAHEHGDPLKTMHSTPCYVVDQSLVQENGCFAPRAILLQGGDQAQGDYRVAAGLFATCTFRGSLDGAPAVYEIIKEYIADQGYVENGDALEFCLVGEYESDDRNEYVSRLEVPVLADGSGR